MHDRVRPKGRFNYRHGRQNLSETGCHISHSLAGNMMKYVFSVYPGEQSPVGAASPEELQYLPGGQSSQPDLLDNPICLLKAPAGHGNATPDCVPVDK